MKTNLFYTLAAVPFLMAGCTSIPTEMESIAYAADSAPAQAFVLREESAEAPVLRKAVAGGVSNRFEAQEGRKMVFTATLAMNVDNVEVAMKKAEAAVKSAGGYVQESGDNRGVLRIPVGKAEEVMRELEALGSVTSRRIVGSDVTAQATDLEIRLSNLRTMRTRLLELLKKAEKVEDALKIETELNRVVTDIEIYEAQQKGLANRIDFVTLTLTFNISIKAVAVPKLPVPWMAGIGGAGADILPAPNGKADLPFKIKLPENFAVLRSDDASGFSQLYAVTADDCVLRLTRRPSLEGATLDFWRTLGRRSLKEINNCKLVRDELFPVSNSEGALFEGERGGGNGYFLLLGSHPNSFCFIPLKDDVFVVEFWGPRGAYGKHLDAVREACRTIRF